jgi:hypothetical protein
LVALQTYDLYSKIIKQCKPGLQPEYGTDGEHHQVTIHYVILNADHRAILVISGLGRYYSFLFY